MVDVLVESEVDQLARLQSTIDAMRSELDELRTAGARKRRVRWSWRRRGPLLGGIVLAGAMVTGIAVASAPGNPADVTFIPLSVPHKLLVNVSIAHAATNAPVVSGGATTVPTDATSVRMTVTVKSAAAGTLLVFPTDNPTSSTADTISFAAGNVLATQVTKQSPGLSGKVSFKNNGTAAATVNVTITGYSTQTTASNMSGSGGTAGQVLTNDGVGGANWQYPGYASATTAPLTQLNPAGVTVLSLDLAAGTYQATYTGQVFNATSTLAFARCDIVRPDGVPIVETGVWIPGAQTAGATEQGLVHLVPTGGTMSVRCFAPEGFNVNYSTLIVSRVGTATGVVSTS